MTDTNPRVTILCAVSEIREFHAEDEFLMAVGDWLESVARPTYCASPNESVAALAIARAFLDKETT